MKLGLLALEGMLLESYIAALKVKEKTFLTDDTYLMDGVVIELERFF